MSENVDVWGRLEAEATRHIRVGAGEQPGCEPLFQFLQLGSFGPVVGWEILRDWRNSESPYLSIRMEWDRPADLIQHDQYRRLVPTYHQRTVSGEAAAVAAFLADMNELRIVPFPSEHPAGLDGTSYELSFGAHFLTAKYCWWQRGPDAWRPMIQRVMAFAEWLEGQPEVETDR